MGAGTIIIIMLIFGGLGLLALKATSAPTPEPQAAPAPIPKPIVPERVPPHEVIPDFLDWEIGDVLWEKFDYDRWDLGGTSHEKVKYLGTNDMFELVLEKETTTKYTSLEYIEEEKHNGYRERKFSKKEVQTLRPEEFISLKWKNKRLEAERQQQKWLQEELQKKERERQEQEKQKAIKKSVEESEYHLKMEFWKQAVKELKND
jgi:hypothetical protein